MEERSMYCKMCGKLLDDTDRHCRFCGTPTGFGDAKVTIEESSEPEEEVVFNPPYEEETEKEKTRGLLLMEEETEAVLTTETIGAKETIESTEAKDFPQNNQELKEFISSEIMEQEKDQKGLQRSGLRQNEFTWNVHEFPKTRKTEDVEFDWKLEEYGKDSVNEFKPTSLEDELFREIREETGKSGESDVDRFFTFSKKNEEFQKLLDREYEKLNRNIGITDEIVVESIGDEVHPNVMNQDTLVAESEPSLVNHISDDSMIAEKLETEEKNQKAAHIEEMEKARASFFGDSIIKDNETIKKSIAIEEPSEGALKTHVTIEKESQEEMSLVTEAPTENNQVDLAEAPMEPLAEELGAITIEENDISTVIDEAEQIVDIDTLEQIAVVDKPVDDSELLENSHKDAFETKAFSRKQFELADPTVSQEVIAMAPHWSEENEKIDPTAVTKSGKTTADYIREEMEAQAETEKNEADQIITQNQDKAVQTVNEVFDTLEGDFPERRELSAVSDTEDGQQKSYEAYDFLADVVEEERISAEDIKDKKRTKIGKIILYIIIVLLVAEIVILGVRYFAPDSGAASSINQSQTGALEKIGGWFGSIVDKFTSSDENDKEDQEADPATEENIPDQSGEADNQTPSEPAAVEPDTTPLADKDALVRSQLSNNVNIKTVRANTTLAYQTGKDYGEADLNQSSPIENNVWVTTDGGEVLYYDESLVAAVIAFDSQWIDYVNGTNKSVLNLLKPGSKAYENSANYSKVGKIKETFEVLEIGEIRQGASGFYVWVHEEITVTESGKTANKKYDWIYYLEPVNGKMMIVNYF